MLTLPFLIFFTSTYSNMHETKTVLLTGAAGFIGANLSRQLLKEGHEVHAILRETSNLWRIEDIVEEMNIHKADLSSANAVHAIVEKVNPKLVFHLAAYGGYHMQQDKQQIIASNVVGTTNLLNAAKKAKVECFVNTGSSSEYGFKDKPMHETDLAQPVNFYGVSKVFSTLLCSYAWLVEKVPTVTLRLFSVYGYFEEQHRLVPYIINCCLKKQQPKLASPRSVRDFVFIEDVVEAYLLASKKQEAFGEAINIGSGKQHSVGDVVETVCSLCKAAIVPLWGAEQPRPTELKNWVADITKAKKVLGWKPKHELREGLLKTIKWHRSGYKKIVVA